MIQECYNMLESIVREKQELILHQVRNLYQAGVTKFDTAARIQQNIIDFGNEMEREFHLQDSELLENLQLCCELLYVYCSTSPEDHSILENLNGKIENWIPALSRSVLIKNNGLSLVVIVFNEIEYIEEWLAYHFYIGVSHIYLYDNGSTDGLQDPEGVLKKYLEKGLVTYIWWPGKEMQLLVYNDALEKYQFDTKYMGFIDADEFLVPVKDMDLCEILDKAFQRSSKHLANFRAHCGGIGVNWRVYGTSGHVEKPEGLVMENYKYRAADEHEENAHIKTICNPRVAKKFEFHPHTVTYKKGFYCTSENGSYIPDAFFYDGICRWLRINHYYSKSEEELQARLRRGKACWVKDPLTEQGIADRLETVRQHFNEVYDPIMERYIPQVKKLLEEK